MKRWFEWAWSTLVSGDCCWEGKPQLKHYSYLCISSTICLKFECESLVLLDVTLSISLISTPCSSECACDRASDMLENDIKSGSSRRSCRVSLQLRGGTNGGGAIEEPPDATCFKFDDDEELFNEPGRGRVVYIAPPASLVDNVLWATKKQNKKTIFIIIINYSAKHSAIAFQQNHIEFNWFTYKSICKYWSMWTHPTTNIAVYSFEIHPVLMFPNLMRSLSPDHLWIVYQNPWLQLPI